MSAHKTISRQKYLTILALFTVASQHYRKAREMESAICDELSIEQEWKFPDAGHISEAIYDDGPIGNFDRALKLAGYMVETAPGAPEIAP